MTWKPQYVDIVVLLLREGVSLHDIAPIFSAHPEKLYSLLYSYGFHLNKLKKMPPLPQEERDEVIRRFCKHKVKAKKFRSFLDSRGVRFSDFAAQPFQVVSRHPAVLQHYADLIFLLIREGIKSCVVASLFSVDPNNVAYLLKSHGFKVMKLKHMPPLPQDERYRIIQEFCEKPSNEEKLRSMLDTYSVCLEDFVTQPFRTLYERVNDKHAHNGHVDAILRLSDRDKEIAELRRSGKTLAIIAQNYGITRERVRQIVLRYNKISDNTIDIKAVNKMTRSPTPEQLERREQILELCRSGLTYKEIANALGISKGHVYNTIYDYNRTAEHPLNVRSEQDEKNEEYKKRREKIVKERKKGKTIHAIAEQLGVSCAAVCKAIKKAGLTRPRRSPKK